MASYFNFILISFIMIRKNEVIVKIVLMSRIIVSSVKG